MRCGCPHCGTYMTHSEGLAMGCVCPDCGYRCKQCLGTNTVLSREALAARRAELANVDWVGEFQGTREEDDDE